MRNYLGLRAGVILLWHGCILILICISSMYFVRYFHYVRQLCSGTMFENNVRGFQVACSTGHYVREHVRMFDIVRRLNSFVLNPMFECSLNICSDPILVVNVRKATKYVCDSMLMCCSLWQAVLEWI